LLIFVTSTVIILDLDLISVSAPPREADPPLIVDPYAVLPGSISFESLQPISRWDTELPYGFGCV